MNASGGSEEAKNDEKYVRKEDEMGSRVCGSEMEWEKPLKKLEERER